MSCGKDKQYVFTREQTKFLISLYEMRPHLYNIKHIDYRNKTKRLTGLREITDDFKEKFVMSKVTLEDIRKKINGLRTQFTNERNKIKKSFVSGAGADDVYIPTLWCYPLLSFLEEGTVATESRSSLDMEEQMDSQDEQEFVQENQFEVVYDGTIEELNKTKEQDIQEDLPSLTTNTNTMPYEPELTSPTSRPSTSQSEYSGGSKKRRTTSKESSGALKVLQQVSNALETLEEQSNSATELGVIDAFALCVAAELKEVKGPVRNRALRRQIMNIIYEAQEEEN